MISITAWPDARDRRNGLTAAPVEVPTSHQGGGHTAAAHVRALVAGGILLVGSGVAAGPATAQTPVQAGFRDFGYGTKVNNTPTADKPESKLWWNDGSWWGSLYNAAAGTYRIYRFDVATQSWTDTGTSIDNRAASRSDALWDAASGKLYIVSHIYSSSPDAYPTSPSQWARLFRYSYDSATQRYALESGFPIPVTRGRAEALTIAKDSTGRLWVTHVETGKVKINWSRAHDLDWATPVDLPVGTLGTVTTDDVSGVIAFAGKIGVMWSNQRTQTTNFVYRHDTDSPETWQAAETVLPGGPCTSRCSDDHLNLKTDQSGRVLAAVKTGVGSSTAPIIMLVVRGASGGWSRHTVSLKASGHTRPVLVLDEEHSRAYVFATAPEPEGAIYVKSSPLGAIAFPSGLGTPFIQSATDTGINNATSTKQNVNATTGLLVLASDRFSHVYLHNYLVLGDATPPAAPTGLAVTAVAVAGTQVDLSWTDNAGDETAFRVERAPAGGAFVEIATRPANTTSFSDLTVSPGHGYNYRVRAEKTGFFSGYSNVVPVTTPTPPPTEPDAPSNLIASASAATEVDLAWTDESDNETGFRIERATDGGNFAEIVTRGPGVTSYADTSAEPDTTYSYRVRAEDAGLFSAYSNTATVTTPGTNPWVPIKDSTFEGGALTGGSTGAYSVAGTVQLETGSPLFGLYAATIPNVGSSYLSERFDLTSDLFVSFYVRVNASSSLRARLAILRNGASMQMGNLLLQPSGRLQLRMDTTNIGAESAVLSIGAVYRVGIHQRVGAGGDAVLEAYLAPAGSAFGAPFASTATGGWTIAADRANFGATGTEPAAVTVDDIRVASGAMPAGSQ